MATLAFKKEFSPTIHITQATIIAILCLFITVVASLHLLHSNKSATKAYVIRKLEIQKADLATKNQVLRMQTARANSLPRLSDNAVTRNMVEVTSPSFLAK